MSCPCRAPGLREGAIDLVAGGHAGLWPSRVQPSDAVIPAFRSACARFSPAPSALVSTPTIEPLTAATLLAAQRHDHRLRTQRLRGPQLFRPVTRADQGGGFKEAAIKRKVKRFTSCAVLPLLQSADFVFGKGTSADSGKGVG